MQMSDARVHSMGVRMHAKRPSFPIAAGVLVGSGEAGGECGRR